MEDLKVIDKMLSVLGAQFVRMSCAIIALVLLCGTPVAGVVISTTVGFYAMKWIGGGLWVLGIVGFLFMLFLSIYVWSGGLAKKVLDASDVFIKH